jgi:hypothetical protein
MFNSSNRCYIFQGLFKEDNVKRLLVSTVCSLLWVGAAEAQTCVGAASAPLKVGGDVAFSSNSRNFTGGVTKDFGTFFVRGAGVFSSFSDISSGKGILVMAGAELPAGASKRISVCPTVSVLKLWGIDPGPGYNISPLAISFGGTVGFEATKVNTTRIVPTFGAFFNHQTENFGGGLVFGGTATQSSYGFSYGFIQFGAGLIFNDRTSLVPSLFVPVKYDNGEVLFSVLFSVAMR